jgi:thiol:disulfide interchange protein
MAMSRLKNVGVALLLLASLTGLIMTTACVGGGGTADTKVNWVYSWEEAKSRAESEGKLIMIDFYADWCKPCKQLDSTTYSDEDLGAFLNESVVSLKVNVDRSSLDGQYKVSAIPAIVFVSTEGVVIGNKLVGYRDAGTLRQETETILDQWSPQS